MAGIVEIDLRATRALKPLSIQLDDAGLDDDARCRKSAKRSRASTRPTPRPIRLSLQAPHTPCVGPAPPARSAAGKT